jgi:hypothetical protein
MRTIVSMGATEAFDMDDLQAFRARDVALPLGVETRARAPRPPTRSEFAPGDVLVSAGETFRRPADAPLGPGSLSEGPVLAAFGT